MLGWRCLTKQKQGNGYIEKKVLREALDGNTREYARRQGPQICKTNGLAAVEIKDEEMQLGYVGILYSSLKEKVLKFTEKG